jgi:hypothetical protein
MMVSLHGWRTTMQAGSFLLTIRKPGESRPAVFAFYDPGPQLWRLHQKNLLKTKTLCLDEPTIRLTRRRLWEADFFGASPVASALDRHTGRDPDTHTATLSSPIHRYGTGTKNFVRKRDLSDERTCRIYPRQVKQHWTM